MLWLWLLSDADDEARMFQGLFMRSAQPGPTKKGRIAPAFFLDRTWKKCLRAELPAQCPETNQNAAQQHEGHTTVGHRG